MIPMEGKLARKQRGPKRKEKPNFVRIGKHAPKKKTFTQKVKKIKHSKKK